MSGFLRLVLIVCPSDQDITSYLAIATMQVHFILTSAFKVFELALI